VVRVFLGKKINLSLNGCAYFHVLGYVHASHRTINMPIWFIPTSYSCAVSEARIK
jgi:hypothetical protein